MDLIKSPMDMHRFQNFFLPKHGSSSVNGSKSSDCYSKGLLIGSLQCGTFIKKLVIILFLIPLVFSLACRHGHKTYPDITGPFFWTFEYPKLDYIDISGSQPLPIFMPYPEHGLDCSFYIDKLSDDHSIVQIRSYYGDSLGIEGDYYKRRQASFNLVTDSITFPVFEQTFGDSIGNITVKYDKKNDQLVGKFYTTYLVSCSCPFRGKSIPFVHSILVKPNK